MDLLGALGILVRVVETGSFSAVARERELSQAAVARQVSQHRLTNRLRAQLGKVEQDRDQDDREHVAACKGDAGRDENGLQTGQYCEKL